MDEPAAAWRRGVNVLLRAGHRAVLSALVLIAATGFLSTPDLAAQEGATLVVQPLQIDEGGSGDLVVTYEGGASIDAYELVLQFDPAVARVVAIEPAADWDPVQHGISVDKGGEIRAAAFSLLSPCDGAGACELLRVTMAAHAPGDSEVRVMQAELVAGGEPQDVSYVAGPLSVAAAVRPPGDGDDEGASFLAISLWLVVLASSLVVLSVGIISGTRWLWRRGDATAAGPARTEAAPTVSDSPLLHDFEAYLEQIERIGGVYGEEHAARRHDRAASEPSD